MCADGGPQCPGVRPGRAPSRSRVPTKVTEVAAKFGGAGGGAVLGGAVSGVGCAATGVAAGWWLGARRRGLADLRAARR